MSESRLEIDSFNRCHEVGHLLVTIVLRRRYDRLVHYRTGAWALDDLWDFFEKTQPPKDLAELRRRDFDYLAIRAAAEHAEKISEAYTEQRSNAAKKDDAQKFEKRLTAAYQRESANWSPELLKDVSLERFCKAVDDLLASDLSSFFSSEVVQEVVRRVSERLRITLKWEVGGDSAFWKEADLTPAVEAIISEVENKWGQKLPKLTSYEAFVAILDGSAFSP